ncbi:cytochrome b/b6 domain-containing protein [Ruegeria sp.]|uniref:cytochrome b n=1 Tax=Ruegeria sp. TaxID=1879320 RepID=UPI0023219999|nr:cytochrome b/b6 domain-containing protein [Ruegeria sp.]MDA7965602.1 cytochrome b/b6 domain-containing protein [Ruegeria sp.]
MTPVKYALSARILHWAMAIGFLAMWASGYYMTTLAAEDSPAEELLFDLHISTGVTLVGLMILRLLVRATSTVPSLPEGMPKLDVKLAHLGHLALYILPICVLLLGWSEVDVGGHQVRWFGVPMPKIFPTMETLWGINMENLTEQLHMVLAYTFLAVAVGHVAAVVKHKMVDGHDVLPRMSFRS